MRDGAMQRLTDCDRRLGPITYGRTDWCAWSLIWGSSRGGDEPCNTLTAYALGWVVRIVLPDLIPPRRIRHKAEWDAATIARLGRDWWVEAIQREYGFCLCDGHLSLLFGVQTHDSRTEQRWGCFLPWTRWRHVRFSLYDLSGAHFWTQPSGGNRIADYQWRREAEERVPKVRFEFDDYDGERIVATTHIDEREWHFGTGWFKWLSLFHRPKISRTLSLSFSAEVGPEKGSWKGGTIGHSIEMLPGELHESAFRRYCEKEHRARGARRFHIKFVGRFGAP